ncbi:MAG: ester cyclase [Actinomycetota bacterium]|nr:ester cyclase [Actinomycetota bacterium]
MTDDAANYRRIPLEIFNEGKFDLIDELMADDYVEHMELPPGVPTGRDGFKMFVTALRQGFPDFRFDVLQQFQDGDMHTGYIRAHGTMSGEFMGMPPSGKSASWEEIHIGRMVDGKLTEHWGVIDRLSMMQQLGFMPGPPRQ